MKRSLFVAVMAVALLVPVASAQAAPTRQTVGHSQRVASGIQIVHASSNTAAHPTTALSSCSRTFWYELVGSRQQNGPDTVLQADLWVLLDYYTSDWCGQAYAEGEDRLLYNCHIFEGSIPLNYSVYGVYHCTHTEYVFTGKVASFPCPPGDNFYAITQSDDLPLGELDTVWSPKWYC